MRKYLKYKDTGIDGIGDVPEHWKIIKLKYIAKICNGQDQKDVLSENGKYPIYGSGGIFGYANKFLFEGPSVLLGRKGTVDKPRLVIDPFWAVDTAYYTKISNKVTPAIFYHLCKQIRFDYYIYGSAVPSMTSRDLNEIRFALPTLIEQKQIERFLDYKTAQIDSFITNRQKQIELLKEQKAGIINKAVTKGINPNAKMKASGIEWIGDIPEHWFVGKVRRVLSVLTDFTANGSFADLAKNVNYLDTPDYSRLIRLTDLREDLKNDGIYVNKHAHEFLSKSELFGGEILMANVGAYAGFVCLVPEIDFTATLGPNMILLKFDRKKISNQYAYNLLSSDCYYKLLMNKALSSAQPKLNKEDVKSIDLIFPPTIEEQNTIIEYIKQETTTIDTLISKYQKQIDLMQEYRTSLISQAVTGKIDVRDWKPKIKEYSIEKPDNLLVAEE